MGKALRDENYPNGTSSLRQHHLDQVLRIAVELNRLSEPLAGTLLDRHEPIRSGRNVKNRSGQFIG